MNFVVTKKYVDAIFKSFNEDEINQVLQNLQNLKELFKNEDFINIINSPQINLNSKTDIFLKFVDSKDKKFKNFLKILIKNKRASLIPQIEQALSQKKLKEQNISYAKLYTSYDLDESEINSLKDKFSKKFSTNIELEVIKSDIGGLKVEFESLGYEINLSTNNIKSKIKNYILKAI